MAHSEFNKEILESLIRIQKEATIAIEEYSAGLGIGNEAAADYNRLQGPLDTIKYHADKAFRAVHISTEILHNIEKEQRKQKVDKDGKP